MSSYRRAFAPGGTFFFTVVTDNRAPILCGDLARELLRNAIRRCLDERPFELVAVVLLPDHLHAIWTLPPNDTDYATRWAAIKADFTRAWLAAGGEEQGRSESRLRERRRGVWQRKFWEHLIRDERDLGQHLDYIHFNPVKHGLAACPHAWPHSSFHAWVRARGYEENWGCACAGRSVKLPSFEGLDETAME